MNGKRGVGGGMRLRAVIGVLLVVLLVVLIAIVSNKQECVRDMLSAEQETTGR